MQSSLLFDRAKDRQLPWTLQTLSLDDGRGGSPLPNIDAGSLSWACSIGRKGGIDDPLTNVPGYLAYQALDMAHQPEILQQLADRVLRAGRTGAHPFYLHRRSKELLNTYDMEAIGARFEKDAELRRSLTGQIAYSATSEIDLSSP